MIVFDIETGPQPTEQIRDRMPIFEAPSTWKDPAKIEAHLTQKRLDWIADAALDATTGQILAIGVLNTTTGDMRVLAGDERDILSAFVGIVMHVGGSGIPLAGWNIFGFDLPFIVRRAWILGVPLPQWIRVGRYWDRCFVDLMESWALGNKEQRVGLDLAAQSLGVGRKSGHGADFASHWNGTDEERAHALAYLENDLRLTAAVAARIMPADTSAALSQEAA